MGFHMRNEYFVRLKYSGKKTAVLQTIRERTALIRSKLSII